MCARVLFWILFVLLLIAGGVQLWLRWAIEHAPYMPDWMEEEERRHDA